MPGAEGIGRPQPDAGQARENALARLAEAHAMLGSLQMRAVGVPDGADIHFIDTLSSAVSLALENGRLYEQQRTVARLNEALTRIDILINSGLDSDEIMRRVVVEAGEALGSESSAIDLREDRGWRVRCVHGLPADIVGTVFSDEEAPFLKLAANTCSVVAIEDALTDTRVRPEIMARYGLQSLLVAPLENKGTITGMLFFNYHSVKVRFSEQEQTFARNVAASVSMAMENAQLLQTLERERMQLQAVLAHAPEGIVVTDQDAQILFSNAAADELFRHPLAAEGSAGGPADVETRAADGSPLDERSLPLSRSAIHDETVKDVELRICWPDGHYRCLLANTAPLRNAQGGTTGAVGVFQDITERREREELSQALNEISMLINGTLDEAEIMQGVVSRAAQVMGSMSAVLLLREDRAWVPRYVAGLPEELTQRGFSDRECPVVSRAARERSLVVDLDYHLRPGLAQELPGARAAMMVPLVLRGDAIGVLAFCYLESPIRFAAIREDFARRLAAHVSLALDNAYLFEEQKNVAEALQRALLSVPRELDGMAFGHAHRAATASGKVSGDFYDVFPLPNGRAGVLMGDVTGRGVEAAARASSIRQWIKAYALEDASPAAVLKKTNRLLISTGAPGFLATVFLAILQPMRESITYASAGHPPALLRRRDGRVHTLARVGSALGVSESTVYEDDEALFSPHDLILLYTDGITKARRGGEFFGEERLQHVLQSACETPADEVPGLVMQMVTDFAGDELRDDAAVLALSLDASARAWDGGRTECSG